VNAVRRTTAHRLEGLDALRGLAAVSVMAYHYTSWYSQAMGGHPPPGVSLMFPNGNLGVELFFIISGFVIYMTLERGDSLSGFLFSRFVRLWPAFLASMTLTILISTAFGDFDPKDNAARIIVNLTMAPELFNTRAIDGSYWSLSFELAFYLLAGGVFFILRPRGPEFSCAIWLLIAVAMRGAASRCSVQLVQLTAAPFCQLFVIGIMLFRLRAGQATVATWAVLAVAFAMTLLGPDAVLHPLPTLGYSSVILGFAVLVWLATMPWPRSPMAVPLLFFGRISYPLYLVHQEVGLSVIARLEVSGVTPNIAVATTAALAIFAAWAISAGVECPLQAWLRARYRMWHQQLDVEITAPALRAPRPRPLAGPHATDSPPTVAIAFGPPLGSGHTRQPSSRRPIAWRQ